MATVLKNRVGETSRSRHGTLMKIVEYYHATNVIIEWQDEYKVRKKTTYHNFKKGGVKNPYDKAVHQVGFLGVGKYTNEKGEVLHRQAYNIWKSILERCYRDYHERDRVYNDCSISEDWCNFQNFAEWYEENYYEVDEEMMCLDKDILVKGNRIYSASTCVFVPQAINKTFTTSKKIRGRFPIGVGEDKGRIRADCNTGNKNTKFLGYFKTVEEAFNAYKTFKEDYIKQFADEYKDKIPNNLYEAMYAYQVEITD